MQRERLQIVSKQRGHYRSDLWIKTQWPIIQIIWNAKYQPTRYSWSDRWKANRIMSLSEIRYGVRIVDYPDAVNGLRLLLQSQTGRHTPFVMGIPHKHCEIHNPNKHAHEHMHNYTDHRWAHDSRQLQDMSLTYCLICAHTGHHKKCGNFYPRPISPTNTHLRILNSAGKIPFILFKGVEQLRVSVRARVRDVGFELIAEDRDEEVITNLQTKPARDRVSLNLGTQPYSRGQEVVRAEWGSHPASWNCCKSLNIQQAKQSSWKPAIKHL